ncbi:oxidoreductase/transition metal ion-binding protein [Thalictrum thalictroides]|uniref:Oxidoreductase/transition metal ion-binding protein n=1 Tax=Thalictrum thalictroides TaxID=46969 RepID=A0A7J6VGL9_THATH|nr:oxidoreductase/transition metal ion-binding protein [Thalictrum thalictroides]
MSSALMINSSPNSIQLRLGFKYRKSSFAYIRTTNRVLCNVNRQIRLYVGASSASGAKEGEPSSVVSGNSWTKKNSSNDAFSGWIDDNVSGESELPQQQKPGRGGIVAAGVAGVILAAGLTLTCLYLSKRNASAPKPDMESLTAQQETLLSSDDHSDNFEQVGNEEIIPRPDEGIPQDDTNGDSMTGIIKDSSSSPDTTEATFERSVDNFSGETSLIQNVESPTSHTDDLNNTSTQEDLPEVSDVSVPSSSNLSLQKNSELVNDFTDSSNLADSEVDPAAALPESILESQNNQVSINLDNPPFSNVNSTNLNPDIQKDDSTVDFSSSFNGPIPNESLALDRSVKPELAEMPSSSMEFEDVTETETLSNREDHVSSKMVQVPSEVINFPLEGHNINENGLSDTIPNPVFSDSYINEPNTTTEIDGGTSYFEPLVPDSVSSAGIPAPSLVSAALQVPPGKVVVYGVVDQVQGQALAALQVLKVIEADVQPGDLCTRREYARWLVSASSALSRNSMSKVYPAMYIENVTELAFDDITTEDPDFASIQGLAEAGLISSKLSRNDLFQTSDGVQDPFLFFPESPLSRQDLVSWKMALEKRQLPEVDKKIVYQCCGFIDIDKINPDAWPALVADQSAGEQGIMALAFGYTRLFQPYKPVTKGQAAIALSTGEPADIVSEELARIEAETMAETAVAAHTALVAQVEKDINLNYEKELTMEREKIDAVEKMAQEARMELERLRAEREDEQNSLMRGRAAVESEMQVLSSLRREVEEQLQTLMSDKTEISFERERINKLRKEAESENQSITRLQYELEVERKALSLARAWAEDEAKRAREQAKALEEARDRWERQGIKVVVDDDLREDANAGVTWLSAGKESTVDAAVSRGESLVSKLKTFAGEISGNSRLVIERIILKITTIISSLKEWASNSARKAGELQGITVSKASASVQELQHSASNLSLAVKEGAKRVAEDCRDGVERISQKFKA